MEGIRDGSGKVGKPDCEGTLNTNVRSLDINPKCSLC